MFSKLLLLFTLVPLAELYILVTVGREIGALNTIALVIITGVAGASLARSQGAQIIYKIRSTVGQGRVPGKELLQGAAVLAGGIMLLTPGFVTDLLGLSLLVPFTRQFYVTMIMNHFKNKFESGQWQHSNHSNFTYYTHDNTHHSNHTPNGNGRSDDVIIEPPKHHDDR